MKAQTKKYQMSCFLSPELSSQDELDKMVKKIEQMITSQEGFISKKTPLTNPIKRRLAYPIQKHQEAFYLTFDFLMPPKAINPLHKKLDIEKNVIRHLISIKKKLSIKIDRTILPIEKPKPAKFDMNMIDKIEPMPTPSAESTKKEKVQIKELDQKLEEILNQ